MNFVVLILTSCTTIVTLLTGLTIAFNKLNSERKIFMKALSKRKVIIGVRDKIPECLRHLPLVSDYKDALTAEGTFVLLYFRNYSFALRKCNWVVFDREDDKVHPADDEVFWYTLVTEK